MLDKIAAIGGIDFGTPHFLISELASSRGFICESKRLADPCYWSHVVIALLTTTTSEPIAADEKLARLAALVNPNLKLRWSPIGLKAAYYGIKRHAMMDPLPLLELAGKGSGIGNPTPQQTKLVPYFLIYASLKKLGYATTASTTPGELGQLARLACLGQLEREVWLAERLHGVETASLEKKFACHLLGEHHSRPDPSPDQEELALINSRLDQEVLSCLYPRTAGQAVVFAAYYLKLDLSKAAQPCTEFYRKKVGLVGFADPNLEEIRQLNSDAYSLDIFPNPGLPLELVQPYLDNLGKVYGLKRSASSYQIYEELQDRAIYANFYPGVIHGVKLPCISQTSKEELTLSIVREEPVVSFGVLGGTLVPHLVSDLSWAFTTTLAFSNPEGGYFDKSAIEGLKRLLIWLGRRKDNPPRHIAAYKDLAAAIEQVKTYLAGHDRYLVEFGRWFRALDDVDKSDVVHFFHLLVELGMYMRGWLGPDVEPQPIEVVPPRERLVVILAASKALIQLDEHLKGGMQDALATYLLELPLMIYQDGHWIQSKDENEGLTIGGRLDIVRQGEDIENINSCIRVSSNWLVLSGHLYLGVIGHPLDFEPGQLRHIF